MLSRCVVTAIALTLSSAGCSDNGSDAPVQGSGGHSNGTGGNASGGDEASGGNANGGEGGVAQSSCGEFDPSNTNCGVCEQTPEEYCMEPDTCQLMGAPGCQNGVLTQEVEEGCGFIKATWQGDVGDEGVTIWKVTSGLGGASSIVGGELVYLWDNGKLSSGCGPDTTVGVEPDCDEWASVCSED